MFLTVYTSFRCNFAGFACKIASETSIKIWDEPLFFKCIFMGYAHENAKSRSIRKAFRASEKFGMSYYAFETLRIIFYLFLSQTEKGKR